MPHTPGPWTVERDGYTLTMGNQIVATGLAPDGASADEQRANARLVAAAPELLAALRACLAEYEARAWRNPALTGPAARARAAIATATGQEEVGVL